MLTNITIGQYYPVKSVVHSMDSRVKLVATILYITMLFFVNNFIGYFFVFLFLCAAVYASNVPPKFILRGLRGVLFIILFTTCLNIFFMPGETLIFSMWRIKVYLEGIATAAKMTSRLMLLVMGSSVLTLTTSPIELTSAIEYLLKPFKRIGVPSHEIAMMMTIALRFIPALMEEMDKIMKAQMARGADFDTGGLMKKAKSLIPLLVPLFVSSFRRADELAMAMEARCYRGDLNRTRMEEMKMYTRDYYAIAFMAVYVLGVVACRFF